MTAPDGQRPAWLIPVDELKAMHADPEPPSFQRRSLTAAEREALRSRLDADARTSLNPSEWAAYYELGVIRSKERITALVQQARREARADAKHGLAYARGIIDAVRWATGETRESPITGAVPEADKPRTVEIEREERAAVEVLNWRRESIHPRDYVTGVEATLMWLRAGCDDPPW